MNLPNYWSLPTDEQDKIQEVADVMSEEEYQTFLDEMFPVYSSFNEAMKAAGADGDE